MRILYIAVDTPIPGTHGGSVHALELCRALAVRGHEVHLVAPCGSERRPTGLRYRSPEDLTCAPPELGASQPGGDASHGHVRVHRLARPVRFMEWAAVGQIKRVARAVSPDVIVERFYTFGGAGVWAAHALGIPAVLEVNSPARPFPGSWRDRLDRLSLVRPVDRWRRRLLKWSDAVYATSKHLLPPERQSTVTVVNNGVDTARFQPGPASGDGPLRCVYVSSFRAWHGAEDLVEAIRLCVSRGLELHVTCLGQGPRWAAARAAAARAGLSGTIRFAGEVAYNEVPGYLAAADVGLAPFSPDAFSALQLGWFWSPIKIFEYLAAGLAVVTVDIEELRMLLPDAVARFYPAGQPGGLADQIEALSSDRSGLARIRQAARRLAESRFTWGHQAAVVESVLHSVVTRGVRS